MTITTIILTLIFIWIFCGFLGGILYVLPTYAKEQNISKKNADYWVVAIIYGIVSLKESIISLKIEKEIKKLKK